ncbi:MAG TPA: aquaporin Z [Candidatus Cloacimonadota bacterium]|nr:aquaporin Z [Candidatus Cloacimonadota bacterium]
MRRMGAEFLGTFWLIMGGCGSAILAGDQIGKVGISLASGFAVLTMIYAFGHISGAHLNPAVSLGLWAGKRFPARDLLPYIVAQVLGGLLAGGFIYLIATGKADFNIGNFSANGVGSYSPGKYRVLPGLLCEVVLTGMFLLVVMGATDKKAPAGFAPIAIGLALTLSNLVCMPVTNTSLNPARSTAVAFFAGGAYVRQLWMFWVFPIIGALGGGFIYRLLSPEEQEQHTKPQAFQQTMSG